MRVALIHYRLIHFGGLETRLKNYIRYFSERGDTVEVVCAKYHADVVLPQGTVIHKIGAGVLPKPFRQRGFDHRLGRFMRNEQFDFSLSLGRTSHQQYVLCPGNHKGYLRNLGRSANSLSDFEQIRLDKLSFERSALIFAASKMMRNEVIELYGIDPEKVKVIYPPLNIKGFKSVDEEERQQIRHSLGWKSGQQYFLFASLGHKRKGLPLLLTVFEKLKDTGKHLIIIGSPEVKSDLPNVHYLGFFDNPRTYFAAADALVHPSVYEPYGQIVAEALQSGTPVIISDQVGASELVTEQEGMVLSHQQPEHWLEAIANFDRSRFIIAPDFAKKKQITLEDHMEAMLRYSGCVQ
ncbi:MAG TPA: glycosyltransferase family 4 protein [Bacteroidales bacterium]|nr:glycosyltransferase family 4 protein [Bacteroidales bacterium]